MEDNTPKIDKDVVLTITLNKDGIGVIGPINNEPIALYLLEKAKDIVKAHNLMAGQPKIQPANGIMGFVRNRFK